MSLNELVDNHIIDCLLPLKHFPQNIHSVADFGTGGGLPAIIYAIHFNQITFNVYEKSILKQKFLNECIQFAPTLKVHGEIPTELEHIDLVMARAFKPLDVILEISRKFYQNKGKYFLLKGRKEKISEEVQLSLKKFKDLNPTIIELKSPLLDVERHLILINL